MSTSGESSGSPGAPAAVPAPWVGLVDDAAIFPPGEAPLPVAVAAYRERRDEPWAPLVGPLVVSDRVLPDLGRLLDDDDAAPVPISVVCTGGAGSLGPAAHWAGETGGAELRAIEIALRDLDDLPGSARRVVRAAEAVAVSGVEVPVYVEVPAPRPDGGADAGWLDALDEVAAADLRLKLRLGGVDPGFVPSPDALAAAIEAALDRELAFKCTAGLHHAIRHHDPEAGAQHGFLNVLLATRASLDGEDPAAVLALVERDALLARVEAVGPDALVRARRWFTSFGCCGVEDPHRDLVELGLV